MIEGESGILAVSPPWNRPHYQPSIRRLTWPNGAVATTYSADEPERLRGHQHEASWCDEVACLVAGTLIETEQCARPIEDLIPGDLVWTRGGLRRVAAAGPTRFNAPLWCLRISNGRELVGTGNHPIWLRDHGFVPLQFVRENDILAPWCPKLSRGVVNAGISSGRTTPELSAVREFAVTDIDPHVISVTKLNDRGIVYNLDVEGEHEYFANGVIVHNSWRYPEAWDMLMFGMRLGDNPRTVVTTTPKPIKIIRDLLADPMVVVTRGSTYENRAFLAPAFLNQIIRKYEGTRLGRQELNAEVLDDIPGALWTRDIIERSRIRKEDRPPLRRIVVAIDPAATSGEDADETGLIVAGIDDRGHGYVIDDRSGQLPPIEWAREAIALYRREQADCIVAETNNGGEMVENTIRMVDMNVSYKAVHASRGKVVRAEPVAALYEQGRIHHIGAFPTLEDQMCGFTTDFDRKAAGLSPDRVDSLVWAFSELLVTGIESQGMFDLARRQSEALAAKNADLAAKGRPEPSYAIGSMEWAAQQAEKEAQAS
jgi:phage terminase large subunit-like protein